jgi:light-harvesting complex 1 beta chain
MPATSLVSHKPPRANDKLASWLIFAPCFVLVLVVALLGQLAGMHWKDWLPGAEHAHGMLGGVKAAVYTFMSHII